MNVGCFIVGVHGDVTDKPMVHQLMDLPTADDLATMLGDDYIVVDALDCIFDGQQNAHAIAFSQGGDADINVGATGYMTSAMAHAQDMEELPYGTAVEPIRGLCAVYFSRDKSEIDTLRTRVTGQLVN